MQSDDIANAQNSITVPPQPVVQLPSELEEVFEKLDQEEQQERELEDETKSLFAGARPELLREREREYRDVEKHWVRKNAWLRVAKGIAEQKQRTRGDSRGLRYLTLPGYYRLDVSLFLRDGLVEVTQASADGHPEEVYIAAFEAEPGKFGRMVGQMPRFKLFGSTTIEEALTNCQNEFYHQLRDLFPFDIVNLDLTTSLTPRHEGPYSRTMAAIETVFELQAGYGSPWALFVTFRNLPSDWEENALGQLFSNLQSNLENYPAVLETFYRIYNQSRVDGLAQADIKNCISQAVAKWLVDRAHAHKFDLDSMRCYYYTRSNAGLSPYDIFKHILVFSRGEISPTVIPTKGVPLQSWMLLDLVECIERHKVMDVERKLLDLAYGGVPDIFDDLETDINSLCALIS